MSLSKASREVFGGRGLAPAVGQAPALLGAPRLFIVTPEGPVKSHCSKTCSDPTTLFVFIILWPNILDFPPNSTMSFAHFEYKATRN